MLSKKRVIFTDYKICDILMKSVENERKDKMAMQIMNINIESLQLDIENKRGLSKRQGITSNLEDEEYQLLLLFCMIRFEKIDDLIFDMVNNPSLMDDLLLIDRIIVQKSDMKSLYSVKEGNRRISSLKVINDPSLMKKIEALVIEQDVFSVKEIVEFKKIVLLIEKILSTGLNVNINKLEVICYDNTEEDSRTLNTIIHRMHVKMKREWRALDKRLEDYKDTVSKINAGAKSIDDAIEQVINEKYCFSPDEIKEQQKDFHGFFMITHFNLFLLGKMEYSKVLSGEQKYTIRSRMSQSYYLPIGDVLPRMLKKGFGIECCVRIENKKLVTEFNQREGFLKISSIGELIYELFIAVMNLEGKKPNSNQTFSTTKKFQDNYPEIYKKYVEEIKNESPTEEPAKEKVNPVVIFIDGRSNVQKKLCDLNMVEKMALHTLILEGRNEDNQSINKENIYIKIRENGICNQEGNLMEIMLDVPNKVTEKLVEFYFNSEYIDRVSVLRIVYYCPEESPFVEQANYVLDTALVKANKQLESLDLSDKLVRELDDFKYADNKYISSYIYRGLWESAIDLLIVKSASTVNGPITTEVKKAKQVEDIAQKIHVMLSSNKKIVKIAEFYGLQPLNAKNIFFPNNYLYYTEVYTLLNCAPHGSAHALSISDVDNARNRTTKWLYIMNYMISCCDNNIEYQ